MKRLLLPVLFASLCAVSAGAETTAAVGGGVAVDSSASSLVTPTLVSTVAGDLSWLPTDRLGFFLDWSGGGSYEPLLSASSGVVSASTSASYLTGQFLGKLSISSAANLSTVDPFYGAVSSELLLSYGGPALSVFWAPRLSFVENSGASWEAGGSAGVAFLVAERLLVKPRVEAGVSIPGGLAEGWFVTPSLFLSWYGGGGLSLDLTCGYSASFSSTLTPLVSGGALLPLGTYSRVFLSPHAAWVGAHGATLTVGLPVRYSEMTYDAFEGGVDLGVPTWLLDLQPSIQLSIPLSRPLDLLFTVDGTLDFSNNSVERILAASATTQLQLHLQ